MANSINKVMLVGRAGKDPEVKYLASGMALTKFSLATTHGHKDSSGQWVETTDWHNIDCWSNTAEYVGKYMKKGDLVTVVGRIQYSQTGEGAERKYFTNIVAETVIFATTVRHERSEGERPEPQTQSAEPLGEFDAPF